MSTLKLSGLNSGSSIIKAPDSGSTGVTFTLPASAGTLVTSADVTNKLPLAGGTMTGDLVVSADVDITGSLNGTSGALDIKNEANNQNVFIKTTSSGSEVTALKIHSGGVLELPSGGLRVGGTALANTLDDYEEGTYAAVISGSTSGTFNMATENTLAYTKIGRLVTVQGYVGIQSGSVGGFVRLSLPFAPTALTEDADYNFPSLMIQNQGNTIAGQKYLFLQVDGYAYFYRVQDSGAANYISNSDVDGNFEIGVTFTYISG